MSGLVFTLIMISSGIISEVIVYITNKLWPEIYGDF